MIYTVCVNLIAARKFVNYDVDVCALCLSRAFRPQQVSVDRLPRARKTEPFWPSTVAPQT